MTIILYTHSFFIGTDLSTFGMSGPLPLKREQGVRPSQQQQQQWQQLSLRGQGSTPPPRSSGGWMGGGAPLSPRSSSSSGSTVFCVGGGTPLSTQAASDISHPRINWHIIAGDDQLAYD